MMWTGSTPRYVGEPWVKEFAWYPTKIMRNENRSWEWIWLESYEERIVSQSNSAMFVDWTVERKHKGRTGTVVVSEFTGG